VECVKRHAQKEPQYIFLKIGTASQKILIDDIEYVESQKRKKVIHLSGGGKAGRLVWYGSMEELEQTLADGFFRIHKGYLINMRYVRKYDRIQVWMQGGDCLLLSKYRYADFVNSYLEFMNQQSGSDKSI
jgi:two-component system LytT family response regulator/two-component system response regulator LytT